MDQISNLLNKVTFSALIAQLEYVNKLKREQNHGSREIRRAIKEFEEHLRRALDSEKKMDRSRKAKRLTTLHKSIMLERKHVDTLIEKQKKTESIPAVQPAVKSNKKTSHSPRGKAVKNNE
ncbi:MAG: hypothetical protein JW795_10795 [Chitinivibrionales bacterium]|nr:hypothetical protein [Chitinivibrionales bacterium]